MVRTGIFSLAIRECVPWLSRNEQKGHRTCQSEVASLPGHRNVSQALGLGTWGLGGNAHPGCRALERSVGQAVWA